MMIEQALVLLVGLEAIVCVFSYLAGVSAGRKEIIASSDYAALRKQACKADGYRSTLESIAEPTNPKSTTPRDEPRTVARAAIRQAGRP